MKKKFAILAAVIMLFALVGCGEQKPLGLYTLDYAIQDGNYCSFADLVKGGKQQGVDTETAIDNVNRTLNFGEKSVDAVLMGVTFSGTYEIDDSGKITITGDTAGELYEDETITYYAEDDTISIEYSDGTWLYLTKLEDE